MQVVNPRSKQHGTYSPYNPLFSLSLQSSPPNKAKITKPKHETCLSLQVNEIAGTVFHDRRPFRVSFEFRRKQKEDYFAWSRKNHPLEPISHHQPGYPERQCRGTAGLRPFNT